MKFRPYWMIWIDPLSKGHLLLCSQILIKCKISLWYDPIKVLVTFYCYFFFIHYYDMILNQHKISNKIVYTMSILSFFGELGLWSEMATIFNSLWRTNGNSQKMSSPCFDIFTGSEVKPNPFKCAHSTYPSSRSIQFILWFQSRIFSRK